MFPHLRRTTALLLCAFGFAFGGCAKKEDPVASAQRFFALIKAGKTDEAYASAAFGFKAQQSSKVFAATVKELGLAEAVEIKSTLVETDGRTAKLRTELSDRNQVALPLNVTLVDESGQWRIFSLTSPRDVETGLIANRFSLVGKTAAFTEAVDQPMPDEAEVRRLTQETFLQFNEAITANSFDAFYEYISAKWRSQIAKAQLSRAFNSFVKNRVNLAEIAQQQPVFDTAPSISTDGLLTVQGRYTLKAGTLRFQLKFIYELPNWKLFGLEITVQR